MIEGNVKIAIVNQFYLPDSAPTAQLAGSLADSLANNGHAVTVVCGRGTYSGGASTQTSVETVRVIRLWTPSLGKRTALKRVADYLAFYIQAAARLLFLSRQDVVVAMTTPPFIALAAWLHKLAHPSAKLVLWNMDSYPEVAEMTGHIRLGSPISRLLRYANRFLFQRLDLVIALDQAMARNLTDSYAPKLGGPEIVVVPNWERLALFSEALQDREASLTGFEGRFVVLYLGNAGSAHTFEAVFDAAEALRDKPVTFLFVGGGLQWTKIDRVRRERGLAGVELRGYIPKVETGPLMKRCDAALITLREEACGLVSPSKLHAYLALSLPIIYVGPAGSNVDEAVITHKVGFSVRSGDDLGVASAVNSLIASPSLASELRRNSRKAFEATYCDEKAIPLLERVIRSAVDRDNSKVPVHGTSAAHSGPLGSGAES